MGVCMLAGCGRLGFEQYALDAGSGMLDGGAAARPSSSGGSRSAGAAQAGVPGVPGVTGGVGPSDAAAPDAAQVTPPSAWAGLPDASSPVQVDAATVSTPEGADIGSACAADDACSSAVCFEGVCCESRCDSPPACYVAAAASCGTGRCQYVAAPNGSACDDGNSCTSGDSCLSGSCTGLSRCDDNNACTQDFCGSSSCGHASTCRPTDAACSYAQRDGHGYWLCPGPVSFDSARAECERIGASLVTVNNEAEQALLWELGMRDTWIGYRAGADGADAGFSWVMGSSNYEAWAADGLDAGTGDRCAYLAAQQQGAWQARACDDDFSGFACEIEQYASPDASCSYARRAGHGYYTCGAPRTWSEAEQRCAEIGAYLVELADSDEHAFVRETLSADMSYAIGVSDAQMEGVFVSSRWALVGYTAWGAEQPNASSPELDYVVLNASSGSWQTVGPDVRNGYVCEQER